MTEKLINYITPEGISILEEEYNYLKKVERPKIVEIVSWAASLGDRSENADYQYGKKRLKEIDRRMRFISRRISLALVVDPLEINSDKVQFGATVTVLDENEKEIIFSIVGEDEINIKAGLVSWKSPIGKSLIGKKVGDEISVKTPAGNREFVIISIKYQKIKIKGLSNAN